MNEVEYKFRFGVKKFRARNLKRDRLASALDRAHEIRKFEIELYWKRTAYFWTLLAAIFAGYFVLLATEKGKIPGKELYLTLVACIGFVFSIAWNLAVKGSKFWQENWEAHIDLLEDEITGPLYKTVLYSNDNDKSQPTELKVYSVSKLNQWISYFLIPTWLTLMLGPLSVNLFNILKTYIHLMGFGAFGYITLELSIITATVIFSLSMYKNTKSDFINKEHKKNIHIITRKVTHKKP